MGRPPAESLRYRRVFWSFDQVGQVSHIDSAISTDIASRKAAAGIANAVWDLTYDGGYGNDAGYSTVASFDCGHIIVGSSVPKAGDKDLLIPGVDQDGKVYVSDRSSSFGGGGYDLVLLHDDSDGDLLSQPVWRTSGNNESRAIGMGPGGELLISGIAPNAFRDWQDIVGPVYFRTIMIIGIDEARAKSSIHSQ